MAPQPDTRRRNGLGDPSAYPGVSQREITLSTGGFESLINLRVDPGAPASAAAVKRACGHELPVTPNRWSGAPDRAALWLGPDEWLLLAPEGEAAALEAALRAALSGDPWFSVVDLSHNYTCLVLAGARAPAVLARGCTLDLHPAAVPAAYCAQTLLARAPVLLRQVDAAPTFEIRVRNSFARYAADWLTDAISLLP